MYNIISYHQIDANTFSEDDLRMFENGGIPLSDSDMDSDSMRGSISDMEGSTNPLNPHSNRQAP